MDRVFELGNIPAGTYDVQAYCVVNVSPQPLVVPLTNSYLRKSARHARFESDPVTVLIQSNRRATIELTISEACSSLYPIPNAATVDRWAPVAR